MSIEAPNDDSVCGGFSLDSKISLWYTADVTETTQAPTQVNKFGIWDALKAGNPNLAVTVALPANLEMVTWDNYPGFKNWLVSELALGWPSKRVVEHLRDIREEQNNDLVTPWPELGKRAVDDYRSALRDDWIPLRQKLSDNIENVGVLAKNNRLITLARVAGDLEDMMWSERNAKTGQLYLVPEWRQTLRQIAEEKGELGEETRGADNTLLELANMLASIVKVQGSGAQKTIIEGEFTYLPNDEVKNEQTALPSED